VGVQVDQVLLQFLFTENIQIHPHVTWRRPSRAFSPMPITALFREATTIPVIPVDNDPRMEAAEAEASRRFSEFETAIRQRDGKGFAVKILITRNDNSEHIGLMWEDFRRQNRGTPRQRPVDLGDRKTGPKNHFAHRGNSGTRRVFSWDFAGRRPIQTGSKVEVQASNVEDWAFRHMATRGLFTVPVIQQIERESSQIN
jgi:uncharacterized protein YegJ (DUF2314 family)